MKKKLLMLLILTAMIFSFDCTCYASSIDKVPEETTAISELDNIENKMVSTDDLSSDNTIDINACSLHDEILNKYSDHILHINALETVRLELFYDREYPALKARSIDNQLVVYTLNESPTSDGTEVEVRPVESISGQNFDVIYFTPLLEGDYIFEYESTDNLTLILAQTNIRDDYNTNHLEKRLPVTKVLYDKIGPYTEVSIDTLLSPEYDPYAIEAEQAIYEAPVDNSIFIPINAFTIVFTSLLLLLILFIIIAKSIIGNRKEEEKHRHEELMEEIDSTKISPEEENEDLKSYWDSIKGIYM